MEHDVRVVHYLWQTLGLFIEMAVTMACLFDDVYLPAVSIHGPRVHILIAPPTRGLSIMSDIRKI